MTEEEFRGTLDASTKCPGCGTEICLTHMDWKVAPFHPEKGEWIGVCFVQCPNCPWKKAAAAGSSERAHVAAQSIRSKVLKAIGK